MDGVTTAIIGFVFVCMIFPGVIKHRHQFYIALAITLIAMALHSVAMVAGTGPSGERSRFWIVAQSIIGLLQIVAVVLLVLAAGGLSFKEFRGEMGRAYEVMRRGEEEKTVIVPLSNQPERPKYLDPSDLEEERDIAGRLKIDAPPAPPPGGEEAKREESASIPLEERPGA